MTAAYPSSAPERTRWILERRPARNLQRSDRPYASFIEEERTASGEIAKVATIFLTNRECPWKCVMCDLWRNTTVNRVQRGDVSAQIRYALGQFGAAPATVLKLYNSGSFFDPAAILRSDWPEIAALCAPFAHLIVECHPRLIDRRVLRFTELLGCSFEIALGLETVHPEALQALNKRVTLDHYRRAASFLNQHGIALRTFLLIGTPFIPSAEQHLWLKRGIECAFDAGSAVVSLIPLRAGNGAIEVLIKEGVAQEPSIDQIEEALEFAIALGRGRVFADTWDLERFARCNRCFAARRDRIDRLNRRQTTEPPIHCAYCGRDRAI